MKNNLTLLCFRSAAFLLGAAEGLAQPAEPAKPAPPARPALPPKPAAQPVPPVPQEPVQAQLAASQAALEKAKMSLTSAGWDLGKIFGRPDGGSRTLVIPKDNEDAKEVADTEEDLNVMSRILEKAVSTRDERSAQAMGIAIHGPFSGLLGAQNLYLDGYGALFLLNVNYPLVAPPSGAKEDVESKPETSSEWEETRRELFHPPGSEPDPSGPFAKGMPANPAEQYDSDKVETLKKNLISALKNAMHIRALKSDETVTLVVASRGGSGGPRTAGRVSVETFSYSESGGKKSPTARNIPSRRVRVPAETPGAKLIIRAKKSDIEAFQGNKIDLDEFRRKVNLMTLEGT